MFLKDIGVSMSADWESFETVLQNLLRKILERFLIGRLSDDCVCNMPMEPHKNALFWDFKIVQW